MRSVMVLSAVLFAGYLSALAASPGEAYADSHNSLVTVRFPISCSESAQLEFNRAVTLLHHMTYPQARAAFERVSVVDPGCAMAHWGIAMTLFQPTWPTRPGPAELELGWKSVQQGYSLDPPTKRERLFLAATEAFFRDPASTDYWQRVRSWEEAMSRLHAELPDDPEASTLYALAHLAVAPAGEVSLRHAERAAGLLLRVLERHPEHPGAMHYMVHANDAPGRERLSLKIVEGYEAIAPNNPHALHMPTHIYTRLGDWDAVIRGNLRAAESALVHPAGDHGELISDEFPHAVEYLVYAYLQKGADDEAAAAIERLKGMEPLQPSLKTAFHLASTEARYALERRDWTAAADIQPRHPEFLAWDRFKWPEAIAWFARGLGAAHQGNAEEVDRAMKRLAELEAASEKTGEELFTRNIRVLRLELESWTAHERGDAEASLALMKEASAIESSTPKHAVTPGPTIPAEELLGDLLLAQDRAAEALAAYRRSLALYPRRFNSLLGAAQSALGLGDGSSAEPYYRELSQSAGATSTRTAIGEARDFLQKVTPGQSSTRAEQEVRQIHEAYLRSFVEEGPDVALERYYADDYTYVGVDGKIIDKAGLKARMRRNELGHFTIEDDLRRVSLYGDVAVLSGHSTSSLTDRGQEKVTHDGYTEVWVRRDGRWQLVAEQVTTQG